MPFHPEIEKKIAELHDALVAYAPKNAVTFNLFVNGEEVRMEMSARTEKQLKNGGISMRNLAGNFITSD